MFYFIVAHFDTTIGPKVKIIIPRKSKVPPVEEIAKIMDMPYAGFFTYNKHELKTANYLLEIKNPPTTMAKIPNASPTFAIARAVINHLLF